MQKIPVFVTADFCPRCKRDTIVIVRYDCTLAENGISFVYYSMICLACYHKEHYEGEHYKAEARNWNDFVFSEVN